MLEMIIKLNDQARNEKNALKREALHEAIVEATMIYNKHVLAGTV